ncbi:MAG: hypothetical protein AAGJ32_00610 [Pseudomonadota bacterium]
MALTHRKSRRGSGWRQAVVFNTVMLLTPFLAANAVSGLFATQTFAPTPSVEAIFATRERIDARFREIVPRGVNARAYWASVVDQSLRENNLPAAKGFLVGAPYMLDPEDARAIFAAANDEPFGTKDEKLLKAAIFFLPNDVRARYERKLRPTEIVPSPTRRPPSPDDVLGTGASDRERVSLAALERDTAQRPRRPEPSTSQFSMLGTFNDLARHSRRWVPDADDPGIELRLTGFGLIAASLDEAVLGSLSPEQAAAAVSVLRSALRANRLQPAFVERLERALDATLPAPQLRLRLGIALDDRGRPSDLGERVKRAFSDTLSTDELEDLLRDLVQVSAIAETAGSVSAVALVEHVGGGDDLRRLRTVVDAGHDRVTALETRIDDSVLALARTGVSISRYTVMQVIGLATALIFLFWQAAAAVGREWQRRRLRSPSH